MAEDNRNKPLYMISVAAELTGMHPQTLRVYESKGLVNPQRSGGNTRLYSRADIERLELINQLTDEGINLAGVVRILDMKERAEERERELFRELIGVSGVGAATALLIVSALQGDELAAVISSGDVKRLKSIKGIGAKTAERIIVDLRDKIKAADITLSIQAASHNDAYDEALGALTMLGFDRKQSEKALKTLFSADPALKVEAAVKKALSML